MTILFIILSVFFVLCCIGLNVVILMQKKRSAGMGSIAGMGNSQTYWDKNKSRSMEGTLETLTKIGGAVFLVFSLILCIIK